jgi:multiple sugar transport system substrate-binding protein
MNILDAFLYNGKRYTVPLSFTFESYRLNEKFMEDESLDNLSLEKLVALSEKYPGTGLMVSGGGMDGAMLAGLMFDLDYKNYVDLPGKKVDVNNDKFISMLKTVKELEDSGALGTPEDYRDAVMIQSYMYSPYMCNDGILDYTGMGLLLNGEGKGCFSISGPLPTININSKNQALAGEFIKFLISEEIQSSPENLYGAVNFAAETEKSTLMYESAVAEGYGEEGFDISKNIELFDAMAANLNSVGCGDRLISEFLWNELSRFLNDSQTAEQTAENLQSRLTMYLNE